MASRVSTLTVRLIDDVTKPARSVAQALADADKKAKQIAKSMADAGATDRLTAGLAKLKLGAKDIDSVAVAWKDYAKSAGLAANASQWTKTQAAGVKAWERQTIGALRSVSAEQRRFDAATARAIAKRADEHDRMPRRVVAATVGLLAGEKAKAGAQRVASDYRKADDTLRYQGAMADLTPEEMASRARQANKLGPEKGVKPTDILHAQQTLAGRGVKKDFVEPFTEELTNYARAMNASMESSAKTLETIIFSTNQHVEDAATARKTMRRQIDIAVKAAKVGGLDDADIQMGSKFGAATGHAGGFKNETIFGILAALSRAGYRGDEGGVATRAIASKLVSPTAKGMDALSAMGINYNDFTKMPGGMSPENLESMSKRRFGKGFSQDQMTRLREKLGDGDVVGNRDEFVAQVSAIIAESFDKGKNGKTKAQDAQKIAKLSSDFYKMAIQSVDIEGLLGSILDKNPALQQLNALFTSQHGGKVAALAENAERFKQIVEAINHVNEGFAGEIGDKRMAGFSGSMNKAESAIEAFSLRVGEANDAILKFGADLVGEAAKKASQSSDATLQAGTAVAGIAGIGAAIAGIKAAWGGASILEILKATASGGFNAVKGLGRMAVGAPGAGPMAAGAVLYNALETREGQARAYQQVGPDAYRRSKERDAFVRRDPEAARGQAFSKIDTSAIEKAKQTADNAKESVDGLNTTVKPNVDSASIDAAQTKVDALKASLQELAGTISGLSAKIGSAAAAQRRNFSFGGSSGE